MSHPYQRSARNEPAESHFGIVLFAWLHFENTQSVPVRIERRRCLCIIFRKQSVRGEPPIRNIGIYFSVHVDGESLARRERRIDWIGDRVSDSVRPLSRIKRAKAIRLDTFAVRDGNGVFFDSAAVARRRRNGRKHDHLRPFQNADFAPFRSLFIVLARLHTAETDARRRARCRKFKRGADAFRRNCHRDLRSVCHVSRKGQLCSVCRDQICRIGRNSDLRVFAGEIVGRFKRESQRARRTRDPILFHLRLVCDCDRIQCGTDGKRYAVRVSARRDRDRRLANFFRFQAHAVHADDRIIARSDLGIRIFRIERCGIKCELYGAVCFAHVPGGGQFLFVGDGNAIQRRADRQFYAVRSLAAGNGDRCRPRADCFQRTAVHGNDAAVVG